MAPSKLVDGAASMAQVAGCNASPGAGEHWGALQPEGRVDRRRPRRRRSRGPRRRGAIGARVLLPPQRAQERVARLVAEQFHVRTDLSPEKEDKGSQPKGARDGQRAAAQALQGLLLGLLPLCSCGHGSSRSLGALHSDEGVVSPLVDQLVRDFAWCGTSTDVRTRKDLQS